MIIPSILSRRYTEESPLIEEVGKRVKETILNFCEKNGYAFISRIKTIDSIAEKIETGRFKSWSLIDDLFACTIIVPTLSHEDEIIEFCRNVFDVRDVKARGKAKKAPEVFRFDSTRITARLKRPSGLNVEEAPIYKVRFEVQVKSAFEHAWAVSTHSLAYKSSQVDWKRLRLAAQLKASVEQLDMLILGFEQASLNVTESIWPELQIKTKISEKLIELFSQGTIPSEFKPKDLSRFCDNVLTLLRKYNKEDQYEKALDLIEEELTNTKPELMPRSLSFFQYLLAIFFKNGFIDNTAPGYTFHVTPDLLSLFPECGEIATYFDYEK
ncbi:hypothetical protein [Neobacillus sp. SAB-20_R2A]|uniref:hypothetical protein n=1 Tax=Neobacillus sp. SAB-20_R2A TaxID=3120519 RepID=UPI003C6E16E9